uniref:Uncharacterized protein n=1 Tax=Arundo donax TaxID=35708 RepID=A0A0A9H3F9_ARUDO
MNYIAQELSLNCTKTEQATDRKQSISDFNIGIRSR